MEEVDKGCPMIRMGVSGCVFLLAPAYPGCPGPKAVKRLCVRAYWIYSTSEWWVMTAVVSGDKSYVLQHNARLRHNMGLQMHFHTVFSFVHAVYIVRLSSTLQSCKTRTRVWGRPKPKPGFGSSRPGFESLLLTRKRNLAIDCQTAGNRLIKPYCSPLIRTFIVSLADLIILVSNEYLIVLRQDYGCASVTVATITTV